MLRTVTISKFFFTEMKAGTKTTGNRRSTRFTKMSIEKLTDMKQKLTLASIKSKKHYDSAEARLKLVIEELESRDPSRAVPESGN